MKRIIVLFTVFIAVSCSTTPDLLVKGNVKGLKKGTLYLQKFEDTLFINIDSTVVSGDGMFELTSSIEEPEVFYLNLDDNSQDKGNRIAFFADKGITEISATLKRFTFDPKIIGCDQQKRFDEYKTIARKFDNAALDILQEQFDADISKDTAKINIASKKAENNLKRKYLYAINFALNNKDSEVAPYIALAEIYDANISYLDTIYNVLPEKILNSKYGLELKGFIEERKSEGN